MRDAANFLAHRFNLLPVNSVHLLRKNLHTSGKAIPRSGREVDGSPFILINLQYNTGNCFGMPLACSEG